MGNLLNTYQLIADILSFKSDDSVLKYKLQNNKEADWEALVKFGSSHLVLTAIYCRLKERRLLHLLSDDLTEYLQEITWINKNRNLGLMNEAKSISQLLTKHKIKHVFLKGIALLCANIYKTVSERMVGDIDILIVSEQQIDAFNLIKNSGYHKTIGFDYKVKNHRHLDRLVNPQKLGAIELHTSLFNKKRQDLIAVDDVFTSIQFKEGLPIPSREILGLHNILAWQINDKGYFYSSISMRSIYDSIVLDITKNSLLEERLTNNYIKSYFSLASVHFKDFDSLILKQNVFKRFLYILKFHSPILHKVIKQIQFVSLSFLERIRLFLFNKSYRMHLLSKILFKVNS